VREFTGGRWAGRSRLGGEPGWGEVRGRVANDEVGIGHLRLASAGAVWWIEVQEQIGRRHRLGLDVWRKVVRSKTAASG